MKINIQFWCGSLETSAFIENVIKKWINKAEYFDYYTVLKYEDRVDVTFDNTKLERATDKELSKHELLDLIDFVHCMI